MDILRDIFEVLTYSTTAFLIIVALAVFSSVLVFFKLYTPGTSIRERLNIFNLSVTTVMTLCILSVTQVAVYGILVEDPSKASVKEVAGRGVTIVDTNSDFKNKTIEWTVFTGDPDDKTEYTDKSFYKTYKIDDETKNVLDSYESTLPIDELMDGLDSKLGEVKE